MLGSIRINMKMATAYNNALKRRHGMARAWGKPCFGLPDAFALEHGQGNHTPSPGAEFRQGKVSGGSVQECRECGTVI